MQEYNHLNQELITKHSGRSEILLYAYLARRRVSEVQLGRPWISPQIKPILGPGEIVEQSKLPNIIILHPVVCCVHQVTILPRSQLWQLFTVSTTEDLRTGGSLDSANLGSEMDFIEGGFTTIEQYNLCCVFR